MHILCVENSNPTVISEDLAKAFFAAYGDNVVVVEDAVTKTTFATKTILKQYIVFVKPLAN